MLENTYYKGGCAIVYIMLLVIILSQVGRLINLHMICLSKISYVHEQQRKLCSQSINQEKKHIIRACRPHSVVDHHMVDEKA